MVTPWSPGSCGFSSYVSITSVLRQYYVSNFLLIRTLILVFNHDSPVLSYKGAGFMKRGQGKVFYRYCSKWRAYINKGNRFTFLGTRPMSLIRGSGYEIKFFPPSTAAIFVVYQHAVSFFRDLSSYPTRVCQVPVFCRWFRPLLCGSDGFSCIKGGLRKGEGRRNYWNELLGEGVELCSGLQNFFLRSCKHLFQTFNVNLM